MNAGDERLLRERFADLSNLDDDSDWHDVDRRAHALARTWHWKRGVLVVAATVVVALVVMPTFGLAGKVIGLFSGRGEPVLLEQLAPRDRDVLVFSFCRRVELVTSPGKPPAKRCRDGKPKIEEIANSGKRFYWKLTYPTGATCLASGSVRPYRDRLRGESHVGTIHCTERRDDARRLLPTTRRPITTEIAVGIDTDLAEERLVHVSGLAGQGVAMVGLVARNGDVVKTEVEGRTYDLRDTGKRDDWVAIAAYDDEGREVYREAVRLGRDRRAARRVASGPAQPRPLRPLAPLPARAPLQHAAVDGVTVDVYRSGLVAARVPAGTRAFRLLSAAATGSDLSPAGTVSVACSDVAYGAGRWERLAYGVTKRFRSDLRAEMGRVLGGPSPPFDLCSVKGTGGRRWGSSMRDAVEVAFTPIGRRFFDDQAAARDLAFFVRSPKLTEIRDAMKRAANAPSATAIAGRYPARVVALSDRRDVPPAGSVGVWSNGSDLIVASERGANGRRLFVELPGGRIGANNLERLAYLL